MVENDDHPESLPLNILHVVPTYLPATRYGGTIQSVHGLCRALAARGHRVDVLTTDVDGSGVSGVPRGERVAIDGVGVHYFASPFPRLYWSPDLARALTANVSSYDVVHAHAAFVWTTAAACRASSRAGIPCVVAPRGMLVKDLVRRKSHLVKSAWIALVERRNLERASAVHVTSHLEEKEMRRFGFRLPLVRLVPNGVDIASGPPPTAAPAVKALAGARPFVLFLGRINWKKGIDTLVRAMALVPAADLVVVGNDEEGYRPRLERLAAELGLQSRVRFVGPSYGNDKRWLYAHAAAFALPSHSENFGNSALEAMAEGCPAVLTPGVGLAEEVERMAAGIVADGNPEALAAALRTIVADPAVRAALSEAALRLAASYTWDSVAERMERVYREVVR